MDSYVPSENIKRFRAMLAKPLDEEQRRVVEALLRDEQAKLATLLNEGEALSTPTAEANR